MHCDGSGFFELVDERKEVWLLFFVLNSGVKGCLTGWFQLAGRSYLSNSCLMTCSDERRRRVARGLSALWEGISLYHFETFNLVESIATLYKVTIITIMEGGFSKILSSFASKDFSQYFSSELVENPRFST